MQQLPLLQASALHILPGLMTILFVVFVGLPAASLLGFPSGFGYLLGHGLVLIPFELGLLFYLGNKKNGNFSLEGIVVYRRSLPWRELIPVIAGLTVGTVIWAQVQGPIDSFVFDEFFRWLPDWYLLRDSAPGFSGPARLATQVLSLVLTGVVGPITEEMYFHGYLLPRLSRFGSKAAVINSVLFVLYHFHDPWRFLTRILLLIPLTLVIQRKRSIYFAIGFHSIGNILGELQEIFGSSG